MPKQAKRATSIQKKGVVPSDDKIEFEKRPEFGLEDKISPETKLEKPKVDLVAMKNTYISLPTKIEYTNIMQIMECAGWTWKNNKKPTKGNYWKEFKEQTIITAGYEGMYFTPATYEITYRGEADPVEGCRTISSVDFITEQKIDFVTIAAVKQYFLSINKEKEKKSKEKDAREASGTNQTKIGFNSRKSKK